MISIISIDHLTNNSGILKTDSVCEVFGDCSFKKIKELEIKMTEADQYILENNVDRKRVFNLQKYFQRCKNLILSFLNWRISRCKNEKISGYY